MSNIKIFRANRGEGKTRWLVARAKGCAEMGHSLYYVGSDRGYRNVKRVYEAIYGEICPIKDKDMDDIMMSLNPCFFTDELMVDMKYVEPYRSYISDHGFPWYITMDQEDFVD